MKCTGAQIIAEVLIEQGVDTLFGYPGGAALNIYEALYEKRDKLCHYLTAHEQGATHAADGYARATGKTGVVLVTSGPGATNTVTGIATAYLDSIPLVVISANVGTQLIGRDSFQEVYIAGITEPVTKHNFIVRDVNKLADTLRRAFAIAGSGRKGPVLVDVPKDITAQSAEYESAPAFVERRPPAAPMEDTRMAAKLINAAERPVLLFGGGVVSSGASTELAQLVHKANLPVCHTIMGTGVLSFDDPLSLGIIGMHGSVSANRAIDSADLLIAVGTRFSDRVATESSRFAPHAKILQFDIDPSEIRKNVPAYAFVIGDVQNELRDLLPLVEYKERKNWQEMLDVWRGMDYKPEDGDGVLHPKSVMDVINANTDEDTIIVTDVGQHQMWAAQYAKNTRPRGFITSGGLGTMGFGYGAAIGAKIAMPKSTVVHITGDGSFHMNLNEACTAKSYGQKVITVIMNNGVLGMVRQWQTIFYDKHYMATSPKRATDFVKLAEGFGLTGYRAKTRAEFETVFKEAQKSEEAVWIEVLIDQDEMVLPMIPAGASVHDTILSGLSENES